jgi:hypothetical protein
MSAHQKTLTLDMTEPELVMWDSGTGTAYLLARGHLQGMLPRTKAITKALLHLALEELEKEDQ